MKDIKNGLDSISVGLLFLGIFLCVGQCSHPKTNFQYCQNLSEEQKIICLQELKDSTNEK